MRSTLSSSVPIKDIAPLVGQILIDHQAQVDNGGIAELLNELHVSFQQLRQSSIDEELFDVISGYEALGSQI